MKGRSLLEVMIEGKVADENAYRGDEPTATRPMWMDI